MNKPLRSTEYSELENSLDKVFSALTDSDFPQFFKFIVKISCKSKIELTIYKSIIRNTPLPGDSVLVFFDTIIDNVKNENILSEYLPSILMGLTYRVRVQSPLFIMKDRVEECAFISLSIKKMLLSILKARISQIPNSIDFILQE